jgi:hypothetical protein
MNKLVVLIKFNRTDLHLGGTYPTGMRFRKTLARKEWWDNRLKILKDVVFPSLKQQTFQDFDIVAPFTTDIDRKLSHELIEYLKSEGVFVCWDNRKLKDYVEPEDFLRKKYYGKVDNVILLNLDSDDVYHKTAFEELMKVPVVEGQVCIFRNGYVYDKPTNRLAIYEGKPVAPPFFAFTFSNESLKDKRNWVGYRNKYNLWVEHPSLAKCKIKYEMPDGLFCYYFHEYNVTSSWENPHHKSKIKELITGDMKNRILEDMGIDIKSYPKKGDF